MGCGCVSVAMVPVLMADVVAGAVAVVTTDY